MSVPEATVGQVKIAVLLLSLVLLVGSVFFAVTAIRSNISGVAEYRAGRGAPLETVTREGDMEKFRELVASNWFLSGGCLVAGFVSAAFARRILGH